MYLVIMQGPPGSGKSTFANELNNGWRNAQPRFKICSTDEYFIDNVTGAYVFKPEKLQEFHRYNQIRVEALLMNGHNVIVDNTNIKAWEARPYVELGMKYNATIVFIRCEGGYPNAHGVPEEKVQKMWEDLEPLSVNACLAARYPWEKQETQKTPEKINDEE